MVKQIEGYGLLLCDISSSRGVSEREFEDRQSPRTSVDPAEGREALRAAANHLEVTRLGWLAAVARANLLGQQQPLNVIRAVLVLPPLQDTCIAEGTPGAALE